LDGHALTILKCLPSSRSGGSHRPPRGLAHALALIDRYMSPHPPDSPVGLPRVVEGA